jgi:hypothetical protein
MRHAKMQRVVEALGNFRVRVNAQRGVHALGADHDIMEIALGENFQVLLQLCDHEREQMAGFVALKIHSQFLGAALLVAALNNGALVHANANWNFALFASVDDFENLIAVADVARVQTNFVHASFNGFKRALIMKVNIGDNWNFHLRQNVAQRLGVFALRNGNAHHVGAGVGVAIDLGHARVNVVGETGVHGLHGNRRVASDFHSANAVISNDHLTGLAAFLHFFSVARKWRKSMCSEA